jgi:hypothetical protein
MTACILACSHALKKNVSGSAAMAAADAIEKMISPKKMPLPQTARVLVIKNLNNSKTIFIDSDPKFAIV